MQRLSSCIFSLCIASALLPTPAMAQDTATGETTISGTVVSSTRSTLVVQTGDNQFQLYTFESDANRPRNLLSGTRVRVVSSPGDEAGVRVASSVTVLEPPPKVQEGASTRPEPVVPTSVRRLERDIERQARRWRAGVRAGAGLDPELILFGVHAQAGPFFTRDLTFRPNIEFAFGEVTTMFAVNLEAVYRLPVTVRGGRWSAYIGGGPGFNFLHQNFEAQDGDRDIDFGDFDYTTGFNILSGVQFRRGTFFEVKTSIYSRPAPVLRLIFGYNF